MVALCSFGYWRTVSERIACRPAMMMMTLTTSARTGRRMKMSVIFMAASVVLRLRIELRRRLHRVVDDDLGAVAQLEGAGADDVFAILDAVEADDEDGVPVGGPNHRRDRHHDERLTRGQHERDLREHSRSELAFLVGNRRAE